MTRLLLVLAVAAAACCAAAGPVSAAGPAGSLSQPAGSAGCITDNGASNGVAGACGDGRGLAGAEPIVLSPDGKFAYTYSYDSGAIAVLTRDPATGLLGQATDTSACFGPTTVAGDCIDGRFPTRGSDTAHAIVISNDGNFLFAAGANGKLVGAFSRNTTTGALTEVGSNGCVADGGNDADGMNTCIGFGTLGTPQSLAISPDGKFLYAGGDDIGVGLAILTVGPTGALNLLPAPYSCFRTSGDGNCTNTRYAQNFYDIALSPDAHTLYGVNDAEDVVVAFARDAGDGKLTPITGAGGCVYNGDTGSIPLEPCNAGHGMAGLQSITVSPDGRLVTVGGNPSDGIAVLHRDPGTGELSQSAGAAGCVNVTGTDGCGTSRTTKAMYQTAFTADSRRLYAAAYGDLGVNKSGIAVFDVAADGTLTQLPGALGCYSDTGIDSSGTAGGCTAGRGILGPVGVTLSADGRFVYAGSYDDGGVATFGVQSAPACSDASASTAFGTAVAAPVTCTDPDGDTVTLAGVDGPGHGSVAFSGLTATYTPAAGFSGDDTFRVKGNDGANDSAPATVTVHVAAGPPPAGKKAPLKLSIAAKPKRDKKLPFKFTLSGKLTPAAGTTCSGTVVVTVKRGKKTAAKKTATLSSACKYKAVVKFSNRKKLGKKKKGKLTAKARYGGNAAMTAKSSKALTVRFG